jgi:uncharacterized repeat protein (TIGR01451 family)
MRVLRRSSWGAVGIAALAVVPVWRPTGMAAGSAASNVLTTFTVTTVPTAADSSTETTVVETTVPATTAVPTLAPTVTTLAPSAVEATATPESTSTTLPAPTAVETTTAPTTPITDVVTNPVVDPSTSTTIASTTVATTTTTAPPVATVSLSIVNSLVEPGNALTDAALGETIEWQVNATSSEVNRAGRVIEIALPPTQQLVSGPSAVAFAPGATTSTATFVSQVVNGNRGESSAPTARLLVDSAVVASTTGASRIVEPLVSATGSYDSGVLTITVTNSSDAAVSQAHDVAVTASSAAGLSTTTWAIDALAPGESRSVQTSVTALPLTTQRSVGVGLAVSSNSLHQPVIPIRFVRAQLATGTAAIAMAPVQMSMAGESRQLGAVRSDEVIVTLINPNVAPIVSSSIQLVLPDDVALIEAEGCTQAGRVIECSVGVLVSSAPTTRIIQVDAGSGSSPIVYSANVGPLSASVQVGPVVSSESTSTTTRPSVPTTTVEEVAEPAQLELRTSADATWLAGDNVTLGASVRNSGSGPSDRVVMIASVPTGLRVLSATGDGWSCEVDGQSVRCQHDAIAAGTTTSSVGIVANVAANAAGSASVSWIATDGTERANGQIDGEFVRVFDVSITGKQLRPASSAGDSLVIGSDAITSLTVSNSGPSTARNITVDIDVPSGISISTLDGQGWTCDRSPVPRCTLDGSIASGGSATIAVRLFVSSAAYPSAAMTATVRSSLDGRGARSDTTRLQADVAPNVDLSVVKTFDSRLVAGETVEATVTVRNLGSTNAPESITVTDSLPPGVTVTKLDSDCEVVGRTLSCTIDSLAAGSSAMFSMTLTLDSSLDAGLLSTSVEVSSASIERSVNNNSFASSQTIAVEPNVEVSVGLIDKLVRGEVSDLIVNVSNTGPSDAADVEIVLDIPAGIAISDIVTPGWDCTKEAGDTLRCRLRQSLESGEAAPIRLTGQVTARPSETITAPARVSANGDTDVLDNAVRQELLVSPAGGGLPFTGGRLVTTAVSVLSVLGALVVTVLRRRQRSSNPLTEQVS